MPLSLSLSVSLLLSRRSLSLALSLSLSLSLSIYIYVYIYRLSFSLFLSLALSIFLSLSVSVSLSLSLSRVVRSLRVVIIGRFGDSLEAGRGPCLNASFMVASRFLRELDTLRSELRAPRDHLSYKYSRPASARPVVNFLEGPRFTLASRLSLAQILERSFCTARSLFGLLILHFEFRDLSGRLEISVRRHKFNEYSLSSLKGHGPPHMEKHIKIFSQELGSWVRVLGCQICTGTVCCEELESAGWRS